MVNTLVNIPGYQIIEELIVVEKHEGNSTPGQATQFLIVLSAKG